MARPGSGCSDSILIVEGPDDKHVIGHTQKKSMLCLSFEIVDKGGVEEVLKSVTAEIQVPGRKAVGFVVDANGCWRSQWKRVCERLGRAGMEPPKDPNGEGTIIEGQPRVGVWMMPDNRSAGELEDFVRQMVPAADAAWPLAKEFIRRIPREHREFTEGKTRRAELYAWLATKEEPRLMGSAIRTGDLRTDTELCRRFAGWISRLFGTGLPGIAG